MRRIALCLVMAAVLCCLCPVGTWAAPNPAAEGWLWRVGVVAPPEGWESPRGESIWNALLKVAEEVDTRHQGLRGRDLEFVRLPAVELEYAAVEIPPQVAKWRADHIVAVLSFADREMNIAYTYALQGSNMPYLMGYGESVRLRDGMGAPLPHAFALDLFRRYRVKAIADAARHEAHPGTGIAVYADRLDPYLAESAAFLTDQLFYDHFIPLPVWIAGAGDRDILFRMREALGAGCRVFVTLVGIEGALDIWRQVQEQQFPVQLWICEAIDPMLASRPDLLAADQSQPFERDPALRELRIAVWDSTRVLVPDAPALGRAYALGQWIVKGMDAADPLDPAALNGALAKVRDIPFGGEKLSIDPATHRPKTRKVAILQSDGQGWLLRRVVEIASASFPE